MSVLVKISTQFIVQIIVLLSVLIVIKGHNYPGGGFIGALMATAAMALYALVFGIKAKFFEIYALRLLGIGLILLITPMLINLITHQAMLTGTWWTFSLFGKSIKLSSPLIFDFGIYFVILASLSWLIGELEDKLR